MNKQETNRPAYVKKIGSVRVVIWTNTAHSGTGGSTSRTFFNLNITRQYRDGDQYKESNTLNGLGDVACLREALCHVSKWLSRAEDEREAGGVGEEE